MTRLHAGARERSPDAMSRLAFRCALALALATSAASASSTDEVQKFFCNSTGRGQHCRYGAIEVHPSGVALVCVLNSPLSTTSLLKMGALRLFDAEIAHIGGDHNAIEYIATSEDTFLTGLAGQQPAERQALVTFAASSHLSSLTHLANAVRGMWHSDMNLRTVAFSPFYPSCIGLRGLPGRAATNVSVEWWREGPDSGDKKDSMRLWAGPALLVAGLVLFAYAPTFADSIAFHYAGGVATSMVLGVLLILYFVWARTGRGRRFGAALLGVLSTIGVGVREYAWDALLELATTHWPYALAYLGFFACLGYALTFYRLRGGRPADYECALLSRAMRLVALMLLASSSHSLRINLATIVGVIALQLAPRGPAIAAVRLVRKMSERGPAPPPSVYQTDNGQTASWRPATRSGRYLSEEEYAAQGKIATDSALQQMFSSPQYQKWLMQNHGRIKLEEDDTRGRRLSFSDEDDD